MESASFDMSDMMPLPSSESQSHLYAGSTSAGGNSGGGGGGGDSGMRGVYSHGGGGVGPLSMGSISLGSASFDPLFSQVCADMCLWGRICALCALCVLH